MDVYFCLIIFLRHKAYGLKEARNSTSKDTHEPPDYDKNKPRIKKDQYCAFDSGVSLKNTLFNIVKPKPCRKGYQKNKEKNKFYWVSDAAEWRCLVK